MSSRNSPRLKDLSVRSSCLVALMNWMTSSAYWKLNCSSVGKSRMLLKRSMKYSMKVCWSISGYFGDTLRQLRYII